MTSSLNSKPPDYGSISPDTRRPPSDPEPCSPSSYSDSENSVRIRPPTEGCCPEPRVDGAWSWLVAVSSFFMMMTVGGVCFTTGVISEEFVVYFHLEHNVGKATIPGAVLQATYLGTGPIASVLVSVYGYRVAAVTGGVLAIVGFLSGSYVSSIKLLALTYGFISGLGFSLLFLTAMVVTTLYFDRWRSLAVGLVTSGSGIGIMAYPRIMRCILNLFDWRMYLQIQAAIALLCLLLALSFRPLPVGAATETRSVREALASSCKLSLLRRPIFILLLLMGSASTIGIIIPFNYISLAAVERNLTESDAAWLVSILGTSNTAGRLLIGAVAHKAPCHPFVLMIVVNTVGAAATYASVYCYSFLYLAIYCGYFGLVFATDAVLCTINLAKSLGDENLSGSFGAFCMVRGITGITATFVAGKLHDYTRTYSAPFYLAAVALALMNVLSVMALIVVRKEERQPYEPLEKSPTQTAA